MEVRAKKHRLPEIAYRGRKVVSITACIENRGKAFTSPETVNAFVALLQESTALYQSVVPVYCFMPDHLHLLIAGRSEQSRMKTAMDRFKQQSSKWFENERSEFEWQANYHDHIVRHTDDLATKVRYILANPVRGGLVEEWGEYAFTGSIGVNLAEYLLDLDESKKFGRRY